MTQTDRDEILALNKSLAKQALRVLMMAYKYESAVPELESENLENDLIFAGLIGMIDPERKEAAEAVRVAKEAGIRPIMITGDHQDTAEAIAKRLGIIDEGDTEDHVFTGAELNELSDEEFQKVVTQYSVYARVSPEHKVRIVKAWQNEGKVVAMTGDGVNDAPALKTADIGIGMGSPEQKCLRVPLTWSLPMITSQRLSLPLKKGVKSSQISKNDSVLAFCQYCRSADDFPCDLVWLGCFAASSFALD
jgi:Ca2+-transporting ATPase